MPKSIIIIIGPTGSGKSRQALALAKKYQGIIINADSRQVYRGMTIGTNKDAGEWGMFEGNPAYMVEGVPEFLVDYIEPDQPYTVADWLRDATNILDTTTHLPIIVGGTGLYTTALVSGYTLGGRDVQARQLIEEQLETEGLARLVAQLHEVSPTMAEKTDLNNPRRVVRALEQVAAGTPAGAQPSDRYHFTVIGLQVSREDMYARINARVDQMMAAGLLDEVKALYAKGYPVDSPAMTGIGYRQLVAYLEGKMTLDEAVALIKRDTRRYAKRQMTWYKKEAGIQWVKNADAGIAVLER